jgi:hypothetical protein
MSFNRIPLSRKPLSLMTLRMSLSRMPLSRMLHSRMPLSRMLHSRMPLSRMSFNRMPHSIMTFSITKALQNIQLSAKNKIKDFAECHNHGHYTKCHSAGCHGAERHTSCSCDSMATMWSEKRHSHLVDFKSFFNRV